MFKIIDNDKIYNRIISGKPYDKDLKPYSEVLLERVLISFENDEEYEKCIVVKNLSDSRLHDEGFNL